MEEGKGSATSAWMSFMFASFEKFSAAHRLGKKKKHTCYVFWRNSCNELVLLQVVAKAISL